MSDESMIMSLSDEKLVDEFRDYCNAYTSDTTIRMRDACETELLRRLRGSASMIERLTKERDMFERELIQCRVSLRGIIVNRANGCRG